MYINLSNTKFNLNALSICKRFRRFTCFLIFVCSTLQFFIDPSIINIGCTLLVAVVTLVTIFFVLRDTYIRKYPLPLLFILGFNLSSMSGALIAQSISLNSLIYNLQVPIVTFTASAIFQFILLISFQIFIKSHFLLLISKKINSRFITPFGLMQRPQDSQLWLMGVIGSFVLFWSSTQINSNAIEFGDAGSKFLLGLTYLVYAPFLIPLLKYIYPNNIQSNSNSNSNSKSNLYLTIYLLMIIVLGVMLNSRGIFVTAVSNLGMAVLLLILLGQIPWSSKLKRYFYIGFLSLLIGGPLLADLAIAMVVVRADRNILSANDLALKTLYTFNDKKLLNEYRNTALILVNSGVYNENYLDNPFVARLVNTKFLDNTLLLNDTFDGSNSGPVWDVSFTKLILILPTPVIKFFNLNLNKDDYQFSMGDFLYAQQNGSGLGGYKVGSVIGHTLSLMGPLGFIFLLPIFIVVFVLFQAFTSFAGGFVLISPVILLQLMRITQLASSDSLLNIFSLFLRTLPQEILLYFIVFKLTSLITRSKN